MTRKAMTTAMLAAALTLVALGSCRSSSPGITEAASKRLQLQAEAVRSAATAGDRPLAEARLAELRRSVQELRDRADISSGRATKVLDAAAKVETQLQTIPTTTTTTTSATTVPLPPPKGGNNKPGKGNNGKGGGD